MDFMIVILFIVKTFDRRVSLENSKGNIHQGDKEREY